MTFLDFVLTMMPAGIVLGHQFIQHRQNLEKFTEHSRDMNIMAGYLTEHAKAQSAVIEHLRKQISDLKQV